MLDSFDHSILLGFVEEAQSYEPSIRQGITAFQGDAARRDDVQQAYRQIHTIKGAALMIGLTEVGEAAGEIERVLEPLANNSNGYLDEKSADALLAQLDRVKNVLDAKAAALRLELAAQGDGANENFSGLTADFEFANQLDETSNEIQPQVSINNFAAGEDEDVDPEMLEVYALEAEEHLQNIGVNLQTLEQNPFDGEALQSIRRSAHTLKGAAGVVGFKTTSGLAHRMEDLLDYLAENPTRNSPQINNLLLSATDALEALSRGATRLTLQSELAQLYARFDAMLSGALENRNFDLPQTAAANNLPAAVVLTPPAAVSAVWSAPIEAPPADGNSAAAVRTVVRVGLDRLDEMVKLMGEMVISRTALEQNLKNIEAQLGEMRLSTARLRRIAGKLEVDYEASALGGNLGRGNLGRRMMNNSAFVNSPVSRIGNPQSEIRAENDKHGFDDLEFDRYTEFHQLTRELVETSTDTGSINGDLDDLLGDLESHLTRQRRLSDELQEKMMRLRMVPLGTLASRLHRIVRVTAEAEEKLVDLAIEGEAVEIDTQVLSSLAEPLLHLLRNAVVHGIENADFRRAANKSDCSTIHLRAFHEGTHVVLSITDDGRGMSPDKLRREAVKENLVTAEEAAAMTDEQALSLVYLPGFSTAEQVNEVAGRGVGMDVVRDSVLRQQGTIAIKSTENFGTTILIRLPMSLAVTRSLIVRAGGQRFAIPLNMVLQLAQVTAEDFDQLTEEKILWVENKFYPVFALHELLAINSFVERNSERIPVLLVQVNDKTAALSLDEVIEAREIVIKPLDNFLGRMRGLLGATILGDGSVVPILDLTALLNTDLDSRIAELRASHKAALPPTTALQSDQQSLTVMIVDDSPSVRRVISNFITKSGLNAISAKDGLEAIEILQQSTDLPRVILSDVEMPRMDGYELLAALKRQDAFNQIPVVMITSRAGEKHRARALELGASEYVTKPYQDSVLLETIKRLANSAAV